MVRIKRVKQRVMYPKGVGTAGATGALAPAKLKPRGRKYVFAPAINYLRQVNEVNGGDNAFVRCVSVCLFVCAQRPVNGS